MTSPIEKTRPPAGQTPTASPTRHFTVVDNKARAASTDPPPVDDDGWPAWMTLLGLGLVALVVGGLGWFFTLPKSADQLYAQILAAAEEGDPATLGNVEAQMLAFREHYSRDPRLPEVATFQEELEVYRLQRRLELRARRLRGNEMLLPVEQAYLDAMNQEKTSPDLAAAKLEAIISVYGSDHKASRATERCVDLARRQLAHLRERMSRSEVDHRKVLAARLLEADNLTKDDPKTSRMIAEGIIALYADKPWASVSVAKAQEILTALDAREASGGAGGEANPSPPEVAPGEE
jgi:hypothetical protein